MRLLALCMMFMMTALSPKLLAKGTAQAADDWKTHFSSIPVQYQGRVMPLDTYARVLALELTGRTHWTDERTPPELAGRDHLDLYSDLLFLPTEMYNAPVIRVSDKALKSSLGLDADTNYFSAQELMSNRQILQLSGDLQSKMQAQPAYSPSSVETALMDTQQRITVLTRFLGSDHLGLSTKSKAGRFLTITTEIGDVHNGKIRSAFFSMQEAYLLGVGINEASEQLAIALRLPPNHQRPIDHRIGLEIMYNTHSPWKMATYANLISLLLIMVYTKFARTWIKLCIGICVLWSVSEQVFGHYLRLGFLEHIPISNTFEVLLWIGLIAVVLGIIGQLTVSKCWCIAAGVGACQICISFSMLVPATDQSSILSASLRSNYWLVVHVLTVVSSMGFMLLAAVLAHIFLIKDALSHRDDQSSSKVIQSASLLMQLGVIVLTSGTVLGGVWAANSWGRFWGWDPKETWSLITILIYVTLYHAKYAGWIHDFGMALGAIVGFGAVVWTFYGVNYVMGSPLHSYGAGSGGVTPLLIWIAIEAIFIAVCMALKSLDSIRHLSSSL